MMNYIANLKGLVLIIALPLKTNSAQLSSELDEHPQYTERLGIQREEHTRCCRKRLLDVMIAGYMQQACEKHCPISLEKREKTLSR